VNREEPRSGPHHQGEGAINTTAHTEQDQPEIDPELLAAVTDGIDTDRLAELGIPLYEIEEETPDFYRVEVLEIHGSTS
jgi:hypothetical protein